MYRSIDRRSLLSKTAKLALAASAATLFASAAVNPAFAGETKENKPVKCMGINACKGQSKCKTATSACAGQNACKGQGWVLADSAKQCTEKGGKVIEE
ncbi:MAG: hypothetical protein PVJ33_15265 [Lysobacterales bacterium]|jgi:hypothetical protein